METDNSTRRKLPINLGPYLLQYQEEIILEHFIINEFDKTLLIVDYASTVFGIIKDLNIFDTNYYYLKFITDWDLVVKDRCGIVKLLITYNYIFQRVNPYSSYYNSVNYTYLNFDYRILYYLNQYEGVEFLTNFKYTKEALKLGIIKRVDLKKQMEINPLRDWTLDVINYGIF